MVETLRSGSSARRLAILPTITNRGSAPDVAVCLSDPDSEVRALACAVLSRLGSARVVAPLFDQLDDKNPRVVQAAVGANAQGRPGVPVMVNGGRIDGDAILLKNVGRTVVPMRALFES